MTKHLDLARQLIPIVLAAGEIELKYFREDPDVLEKLDGSPVTLADQEAEKLIVAELKKVLPDVPVVGEESVAAGIVPDISGGVFWLVDPLDGTRDFITGRGDFTVNIALMENFKPVMGIIYAPVSGALYFGAEGKAFSYTDNKEKQIKVRVTPEEGITVVASKHHTDSDRLEDFLRGKKIAGLTRRASSLKFCAIAAGEADLYPRLGPTSEWDTAAGEAIVNAAGGTVMTLDGQPLTYGKVERKFLNLDFVVSA